MCGEWLAFINFVNKLHTYLGGDRGGQDKCTACACEDDYKEANKSGFCSQVCLPISVESCRYISGQGYKKHSYPFPKDPTHLCAEAQHTDFVLLTWWLSESVTPC